MSLVTAHFHISLITVTNGAMTIIRSEQNETRWCFCHDKLKEKSMWWAVLMVLVVVVVCRQRHIKPFLELDIELSMSLAINKGPES